MKHISQLENFVHPPLEAKALRKLLLSAVYTEAITKLTIYQRSQRINARRCEPKKESTSKYQQNARRSSKKETLKKPDGTENVLSEKMLNEIRLDQELNLLRKIYGTALSELESGSTSKAFNADDIDETTVRSNDQLYSVIEQQKPDKNEVEQALDLLNTNKEALKVLKMQLAEEQQAAKERLVEQDDCIATLRHNLRNVRLLNELELRLVQRWEENRYTQASIVGANEERTLQQQIDDLRRRIAGEECIIVQVDKFSVKQFAELNAKIAAWQLKYARVMEIKCTETQAKERQILKLQKSWERHRETYAERQKFVRDYLEEKEVERQLYEQQIYRVECAVRIQAWWRGLMVRRGLGPFKKKSKKGKKGKGKAK
ncbi:dynein regulatory complex protein 9 [Bactrocera neohumeralis]|uniref:dynein regulatory complex protein 9 n=1 Tax=Bactrocera neohumeralis TaxID=98809 RepID=UPI002166A5AB|nr:dynein regulatory complex protein 9 [Bactrocera neohumeralis]